MSARGRVPWVCCAALLLMGCGHSARILLEEPSSEAQVKVVVTFAGSDKTIAVLPADQPFSATITDQRARGDVIAVWVFRYSAQAVVAAFPALKGRSASEVSALLSPSFTPAGGAGAVSLPITSEVLYALLEPNADGQVAYQVRPYGAWLQEIGDHPERAFRLDLPKDVVCANLVLERTPLPPALRIDGLAAVSGTKVLFTGTATAVPTLGTFEDGRFTLFGTPQPAGGWTNRVAWDPVGRRGVAVDRTLNGHRFDLEGTEYPFPTGHSISEISIGRDGSLFILEGGLQYEETPAGWSNQLGSPGFYLLRVVHRTRRVAWLNEWIRVNTNGSDVWDPNGVISQHAPYDTAADASRFYAIVDTRYVVAGRDPPDSWGRLEGFDAQRATTLLPLEADRVAVGGTDGYLAVLALGHVCGYELGPGISVVEATAAPGTGAGFVGLASAGRITEILRIFVGAPM